MRQREIEQKPKMGKTFDPAECFRGSKFRGKDDFCREVGGSAALTGNPEFFFKIGGNIRNGFYKESVFHSKTIIPSVFRFVKRIFFQNPAKNR